MINPTKAKYHRLYWAMADAAAAQSVAKRRKVGAIIVAPTGMISVGWNGMPSGFDGECEIARDRYIDLRSQKTRILVGTDLTTRPEVIHAERNAIDKMTRQGVPIEGAVLFVTLSPCLQCAKSIHGLGFKHIYYREGYRCLAGIEFLEKAGVPISQADAKSSEKQLATG